MLKTKLFEISAIIELEKKFKGEFNSSLFLEQLVYIDDVAVVPIEFCSSAPQAEEIKDFLKAEVMNFTSKTILKQ